MHEVTIDARPTAAFADVLPLDEQHRLNRALAGLRSHLDGRHLWHVNSTAAGGGVAEMLASLLPYAAGACVEVRWRVVEGDDEFFTVTKRLHNRLHGAPGDGGPLGPAQRARYDDTLGRQADELLDHARPGDVAVLHDPQTAGLVRPLQAAGVHVIWRCHIGIDDPDDQVREAWTFLRDDVAAADVAVFTRRPYAWDGLPADRVATVAPCIDIRSPKNAPLDDATRDAILHEARIMPAAGAGGHRGLVRDPATLTEAAPAPPGARLVVQVSRWDRLKDPVGLLRAFADHGPPDPDVHLLLVGPMDGVADDPESTDTFAEVRRHWHGLPDPHRRRSHLVRVPMDDPAENAAVVNAIQRRADVVVQKSLAEGFGLTVAEAMWKARPVVASRVGGIQDQIVHGESGLLVDDPTDLASFGAALREMLGDHAHARRLGGAARARVADRFLPAHHFAAEASLVDRILPARVAGS